MFISFAPPKEPSKEIWFNVNANYASSPKANEPKKRSPEMPTSAKTGARYTSLYALPFWLQFAPFPVFPPHRD